MMQKMTVNAPAGDHHSSDAIKNFIAQNLKSVYTSALRLSFDFCNSPRGECLEPSFSGLTVGETTLIRCAPGSKTYHTISLLDACLTAACAVLIAMENLLSLTCHNCNWMEIYRIIIPTDVYEQKYHEINLNKNNSYLYWHVRQI